MKTAIPSKILMPALCIITSTGAFFASFSLYSHFSRQTGEAVMIESGRLLGAPEEPAPATPEPEAPKETMDAFAEAAERPEAPKPEPEPEPKVAEAKPENSPPSDAPATETLVKVEHSASAGSIPPGMNNSLNDVRDDLLSKEQNIIQVPNFPVPGTTTSPEPSGNSNADTVANNTSTQPGASDSPSQDAPVDPVTDPDTTPDADPTDPVDDTPVASSNRESRIVAALERSGGENSGLTNALTRGSSQTETTEPVEEMETTAMSLVSSESVSASTETPQATSTETTNTTRPAPQQGRVVVGQSSLYSNALGGSVSGLIGGMEAPTSTQRVQFRGGNSQAGFQHANGSKFTTTPNVVNANVASAARGIPNNSPVSAAVSNGVTSNGGNSSNAITSALPPGLSNITPSANNGNGAGAPTSFPGKAGFTPPGQLIRVNAGRR